MTYLKFFQATTDFLIKGGFFMIPLCITLIIGITTIIYKILSLRQEFVIPKHLVKQLSILHEMSEINMRRLWIEIKSRKSNLARLCEVAVKNNEKPQSEIILAVEAKSREETVHLYSGISILDIVITVAPLLGLLGTASGLVTIFAGLSETTDHLVVAKGIAEALNSTILGLTIAVPSIIAHGYFTRKIEIITAKLETILTDFIYTLKKLNE